MDTGLAPPSALLHQPAVFQDGSSDDAFTGIASALKALIGVAEQVFAVVEARAASDGARLGALNARLARVRDKVAAIAVSSKAVTLYATPTYPATDVARHAMFACLHDGVAHPAPDSLLVAAASDDLAPLGAAVLADRARQLPDDEVLTRSDKRAAVVSLLARVSWQGGSAAAAAAAATSSTAAGARRGGLGRLPDYLPSVASVLLFNSGARPYTEQASLDDLISREDQEAALAFEEEELEAAAAAAAGKRRGGRGKKAPPPRRRTRVSAAAAAAAAAPPDKRRALEEEAERRAALGEAPKSLVEGETLPALAAVEYVYRPKMRDMAALALPSNLALPNVADLTWRSAGPSIAPSVVKHETEEIVPTIMDIMPLAPPPPQAPKGPAHSPWLAKLKKVQPKGEGGEDGDGSTTPPRAIAAPKTPAPMSMMDEMAMKMALRRKAMQGDVGNSGGKAAPKATAPPPPPPPPPAALKKNIFGDAPTAAAAAGEGVAPNSGSLFPPLPSPSGAGGGLPPPPLPSPPTLDAASGGGGLRPEGMHGFKLSSLPKKAVKPRADSDDWPEDDDD